MRKGVSMSDTICTRVTKALVAASLPINGVSIGNPNDRATWSIDWAATPTAQQQTQARNIAATVPLDDDAADKSADFDAAWLAHRVLVAMALVVADLTGKTPAQIRSLVKAKYQALP